ncbi:MAG: putative integral rane protein [Phycisphaerales bacterium]|nr:putative integral rane protein [Phycisphaerales bacterium]
MAVTEADKSAEKETGRLEAFSDGVFGIAMTLLVLELRVPHLSAEGGPPAVTVKALAAALAKEWPSYFAFVTSFFTVLVMWVHHHAMFRLVRRTDARLLFANGFLLMLVTAVPFPTAVIAEYLMTPAAKTACAFYGGMFVLIAIAFQLVLQAAFRPGMLSPDAPDQIVRRFKRNYRAGPILYFLATLVALLNPWLSMAIFTAMWVFWALSTSID